MITFLTRYYFDELSSWVVLTPLALSFFAFFGFFLGDLLVVNLSFTLVCFSFVCVSFFDVQDKHQKMFALFPIPIKTFIVAEYLFLSGLVLSYCTYSVFIGGFFISFIEKQLIFPSVAHWLVLLCANFILLALYMVLKLTNFQFIMGILPFFIPFIISKSTHHLGLLVDSMPLLFSVAALSFATSVLITYYFSTRRDIL